MKVNWAGGFSHPDVTQMSRDYGFVPTWMATRPPLR
jgi:hypothetical protein